MKINVSELNLLLDRLERNAPLYIVINSAAENMPRIFLTAKVNRNQSYAQNNSRSYYLGDAGKNEFTISFEGLDEIEVKPEIHTAFCYLHINSDIIFASKMEKEPFSFLIEHIHRLYEKELRESGKLMTQ